MGVELSQESVCLHYRPSSEDEHVESSAERPRWCIQAEDSGFGRRPQDRAQDGGGDPKGERGPKTPPSRENHQRPQDGARTELSRWSPRNPEATDGQSGPNGKRVGEGPARNEPARAGDLHKRDGRVGEKRISPLSDLAP